jgi:glycolate oxidase iron-sulfur subunit
MASMEALARLMRELEDQLVVCMRCGMCQSVCAVFDQTGREADVARGKLALLSGLMESMFEDPEGVYERLNKCLLCGSCTANCPSGVNAQEIFLKARAILTGFMGLSPAKRLILKGMLANPALFDRLTEWGARLQRIFSRPVNEIVGTSCARVMSPLIQDRHFRTLAPVPFHRQVPGIDRSAGKAGLKVALFTGCLIDKMFPHIAHSTIKVLDHLGVGLYLPEHQGCCGIPALSSGDLTTFHKLLAHNLERFENGDFDVLVTACATCTSTIHEVWPAMADDRHRDAAVRLARRTMDIHRFLIGEAKLAPLAGSTHTERRVTYHDPCHLKKSLKVFAEPRAVIDATPGYRLIEMAQPDWCCGMGGSFNLQHYDISKGIGQKKAAQIQATGADIVATGCPACMIQISDMLSQTGASIAVRHPIELYAEALNT